MIGVELKGLMICAEPKGAIVQELSTRGNECDGIKGMVEDLGATTGIGSKRDGSTDWADLLMQSTVHREQVYDVISKQQKMHYSGINFASCVHCLQTILG